MKRLLPCLLSLLLCLCLCACGGSDDPVQEAPQEGGSHISAVTGTETEQPANAESPASAEDVSDEALLQAANDKLLDQWFFLYGLRPGAVFELKWEPYTTTIDSSGYESPWFPVVDPQVQSLDDIRAVWADYFCSSVPMPEEYLVSYREFDGVLCSNNLGIGDDITFQDIRAEEVISRDGESATLLARVYRIDYATEQPYTEECILPMVWEDGQWKCADIQPAQ